MPASPRLDLNRFTRQSRFQHPEFELAALSASVNSAGRPYREAAKWRAEGPIPEAVAGETVRETTPDAVPDDVDLLFSLLPSSVGKRVEPAFAETGYAVWSNSSIARLDNDVPLVVPEANADHLDLFEIQCDGRGWEGALVKNPNCSTITMVPSLTALDEFGLERVTVATLQAVSGAGYSGVTQRKILDTCPATHRRRGGEDGDGDPQTPRLVRRREGPAPGRGGVGFL